MAVDPNHSNKAEKANWDSYKEIKFKKNPLFSMAYKHVEWGSQYL